MESEALTALAVALTTGASSGEPGEAREPQSDVSAISPAELQVFGAELTQTLRMRRQSIDQAAARLGVPSSEVTRWAQGEDLPSEPQAHALDEYLTARGAIQNLVIELRSRPDRPSPRLVSVPVPSLANDFSHPVCKIAGVDNVSAISAALPATQ